MSRIGPFVICVGITLACLWCGLGALIDAGNVAPARGEDAPPSATPTRRGTEPHRTAVGATEARFPPPAPAARSIDFDATITRLVELGVSMWEALEAGDRPAVQSHNDAAESLLVALRNGCPAAGELAVDRRTRSSGDPATVLERVRRQVLLRVLRDALEARRTASERGLDRAPLDALVTAMLAAMPMDAPIARDLGDGLLVGTPYLGPAHEAQVLQLAELVAERPFLVDVVAGLLRTLWHNLQSTGASGSERLAALALLFLEDGNGARRLAAMQQLLRDARFRHLAIEQVVRSGDAALARQLAQTASAELPPESALGVLTALADVGGEELLGPFLLLGTRDPGLLATEYERVLADGVRPGLRASLVTGACAGGDAPSLQVARTAFDHDPDPEVRLRALYALSTDPDPVAAEAALTAALDDPRRANDRTWVAGVAIALRNLAATGAVNALDRLGRRLERHPLLDEAARGQIRALLAEHVPGAR